MAMPRSPVPIEERRRDYYARNKTRIQAYKKTRHQRVKQAVRVAKYGLTIEQYEDMRLNQLYCCAICGENEANSRDGVLAVDHDHETGKVRGLLCNHCNLGLGHLNDNPKRLRVAADYLEKALDRRM